MEDLERVWRALPSGTMVETWAVMRQVMMVMETPLLNGPRENLQPERRPPVERDQEVMVQGGQRKEGKAEDDEGGGQQRAGDKGKLFARPGEVAAGEMMVACGVMVMKATGKYQKLSQERIRPCSVSAVRRFHSKARVYGLSCSVYVACYYLIVSQGLLL